MQLRKSGHPYIEVILAYYRGCNSQDFDLMMSTFTPDIVHYFVDHSAVVGAEALANYWCKVAPKTNANWEMDQGYFPGEFGHLRVYPDASAMLAEQNRISNEEGWRQREEYFDTYADCAGGNAYLQRVMVRPEES